jgi:hypothetical protein
MHVVVALRQRSGKNATILFECRDENGGAESIQHPLEA